MKDRVVSALIRHYFGQSHIVEVASIACTVSFFVIASPVQIGLIDNASSYLRFRAARQLAATRMLG